MTLLSCHVSSCKTPGILSRHLGSLSMGWTDLKALTWTLATTAIYNLHIQSFWYLFIFKILDQYNMHTYVTPAWGPLLPANGFFSVASQSAAIPKQRWYIALYTKHQSLHIRFALCICLESHIRPCFPCWTSNWPSPVNYARLHMFCKWVCTVTHTNKPRNITMIEYAVSQHLHENFSSHLLWLIQHLV